MGRELKRVAIDFKWPIDQLWKGFINPFHSQKCKTCDGSGLNPATKKLQDEWYNFDNARYVNLPNGRRYNDNAWCNHLTDIEVKALVDAGRLMDFTRTPINDEQRKVVEQKMKDGGNSWLPYDNGYMPTADEVNEWNRKGMGHDAINSWICVKARAKHLGIYGKCEYCEGEGEVWQSEEIQKLHDEWKEFQPPVGDGFQLWSNTTEGHPMTPVFATLELLCEYCENEKVSVFGSNTASKYEWMKMLDDGHVFYKQGNAVFI